MSRATKASPRSPRKAPRKTNGSWFPLTDEDKRPSRFEAVKAFIAVEPVPGPPAEDRPLEYFIHITGHMRLDPLVKALDRYPHPENVIPPLAEQYLLETGRTDTSSTEADAWSALYLSEDTSSAASFFTGVLDSFLAKASETGRKLALAAGARAWQLLQKNPGYTPPDSAMEDFRNLPTESRKAWAESLSAFHVHSSLIEGVKEDLFSFRRDMFTACEVSAE